MLSDIEIAQKNVLLPVDDIASKIGIKRDDLVMYGKFKAKLSLESLYKYADLGSGSKSNLILVTAITPTPAGEGKSTVSIGLGDALRCIGKKSVVALREPSFGPCLGIKGGGLWRLTRTYLWRILNVTSRGTFMQFRLLQI